MIFTLPKEKATSRIGNRARLWKPKFLIFSGSFISSAKGVQSRVAKTNHHKKPPKLRNFQPKQRIFQIQCKYHICPCTIYMPPKFNLTVLSQF